MTRAAWVAVNTLALAALAEGAARLAEWLRPPSQEVAFDYAPYRMLRMSKAPWPLNREGFRAQELDSYRGSFLVEFLGGSVCLGVGTHPGPTLPERLEAALHRAGLERARVLNLCQGGATSAQELAIFLEYGLPLGPQVVLSFNGANDLMHPRPIGEDGAPNLPYRHREMRALFEGHHTALAHLALSRLAGRAARRILPDHPAAGDPVPPAAILNSYLYVTEVTRTLTESQGGLYAVLLQPTLHYAKPWSAEEAGMWRERRPRDGGGSSAYVARLYEQARTALAAWSRETGGRWCDLTRVFEATRETVYSDSVHFTGETGYRMLAEELQRRGWIEEIARRYRAWEQHQPGQEHSSWRR
jgi:hypothetical protein